MKKSAFIIFIGLFFSPFLVAQDIVNNYNKWLKDENLFDYLIAENVDVIVQENENFQVLHLKFNTQSKDTALSYWNTLNSLYAKNQKSTLPQVLFYHYLYLEQSKRPDTLVIQLTDNEGCMNGFIYFDESNKKLIDTMSLCLAQIREIKIPTDKINLAGSQIKLDNTSASRDAVYQKILNYSKKLYTQDNGFYKKYTNKYVSFNNDKYLKGNEKLTFTVSGIKNEVLQNYDNDFVCWLLSYFYDEDSCKPWEYLSFEIKYTIKDGSPFLIVSIDGRVSDGMAAKPTIWSRAKPMEAQFDDFLNTYADKYKKAVFELLSK